MSGAAANLGGYPVSKKLQRVVLMVFPVWVAAIAFVAWGFTHKPGDTPPFPGAGPIWGSAAMAVVMLPAYLLLEWLYETGRLTRTKSRARVRRLPNRHETEGQD